MAGRKKTRSKAKPKPKAKKAKGVLVKMGRPEKDINWTNFKFCCMLMATKEEICGVFNLSDSTLQRKIRVKYDDTFEGVLKRFSGPSKVSLRRTQFKLAKNSTAMAIWLGKQYLGQMEPRVPYEDDRFKDEEIEIIPAGHDKLYKNRMDKFLRN